MTLSENWITRIANAASHLYWSEIASLSFLSSKGVRQAVADLDYFINVLLALSIEPSPQLITYTTILHRHLGDQEDEDVNPAVLISDDKELHTPTVELAKKQIELGGETL